MDFANSLKKLKEAHEDFTYDKVFKLYGATHDIRKGTGTSVNLSALKDNECVCKGGNNYYWILTRISTTHSQTEK